EDPRRDAYATRQGQVCVRWPRGGDRHEPAVCEQAGAGGSSRPPGTLALMCAQPYRRFVSLLQGVCVAMAMLCMAPGARAQAKQGSVVELEEKSQCSRIRVTKEQSVRTLWFVRESGEALIESQVNLDKPHELLVPYTRYMFGSYLLRPKPEKVLIVGLGGG